MEVREILNLEAFALDGAVRDLVKQLDEAIAEINSRRPLPTGVVEKIQSDVLADRVHSSAVTEGNRLSRRETLVVLSTGLIEAGSRKDALEVRNLASAIMEVEEALRSAAPLNSHLVRQLHQLVLQDLDNTNAGRFRTADVAISGAKMQPPSHIEVQPLLDAAFAEYEHIRGSVHPVQQAAWLHWVLTRIHPFQDGNGRIARLVQDHVLLRNWYVPAPLRGEDRETGAYYSALESADIADGDALVELVAKNTLRMADRYRSILSEYREKTDWLASIAKVANEKVRQTSHRRFLMVQRSGINLKNEFVTLASQLQSSIEGLSCHVRDYGGLDFDKYKDIEEYGSAKQTWLFGIQFRVEDVTLKYIFWYGSHHRKPLDPFANPPASAALLVSAQEGGTYETLDELGETRVSLRELISDGSLFWRRRYNPVAETDEWDQAVSAGTVARNFLEEILRKLGLV